MRPAIIMWIYALVLVGLGLYAFNQAPNPRAAATALIVPSIYAALMIVSGLCALLIARHRRIGMIGIHLGLVLPLLFAAVTAQRAWSTTSKLQNYPAALSAFTTALAADPELSDFNSRKAFFKDRSSPDHDTTYLRNTLWSIVGVSVLTFGALLAVRPRPAQRSPLAEMTGG